MDFIIINILLWRIFKRLKISCHSLIIWFSILEEIIEGENFSPFAKNAAQEIFDEYDQKTKNGDIDKEELDDFEKFLAIMFFTRTKDLYKIAGNDEMLLKLLKERKRVSEDPEIIKEYYKERDEKYKKDFE